MKDLVKKLKVNRIIVYLIVTAMIVAGTFGVETSVKAEATAELENTVFSYAYDIQRTPAFPRQGNTITAYDLDKPLNVGGIDSERIENAGSWKLTKIGTYSIIKNSDKDSDELQNIITNIASKYDGVTEGEIVIHELKENGRHIAYGVTLAYDSTDGLVVFLGDNWHDGAGYMFSKVQKSGTVTMVANYDVTNWVPPTTYKIEVNSSTHGTTTTSINETIAGDIVTVYATPDFGYVVESVKYNDGTDHPIPLTDGKYTFTMPQKDVTVTVIYDHKHEKGTKHDAVEGNCVDKGVLEYYDCAKGCSKKLDKTGAVITNTEGTTNPSKHKTAMKKTEKVPATAERVGVKAYWTCESCGISYADEAGTILIGDASALEKWKVDSAGGQIAQLAEVNNEENNEMQDEDTEAVEETKEEEKTEEEKTLETTSPQTGDNSHLAMWFALLFVSGGMLTITGIYDKKKSMLQSSK